MKTIDLSKNESLEGHIVLWAKGWYGRHPDMKKVLEEVLREYTGMADDYNWGPKSALDMLSRTADLLGIKGSAVTDSFLRQASYESDRLTSYHVGWESEITPMSLFYALMSEINIAVVNTEHIKVLLPDLLPGMKEKYRLTEYTGRSA